MKKEDLLERLFHLENGIVNYKYLIMKKVMKSKKYVNGGSTIRPVQGAPKPKPLTPTGTKKPVGPPYAKPTPKPTPKPVAKTPVKPVTKPAVKTPVKPTPKPATPSYGPKTTAVLDYMKPSNTLATKPKPVTPAKPAAKPAAPAAKTVSQLWTEKTGTPWSEAKKQGLSDGSAKSNMEIMKKLQSGSINKETIATMKDNSKVATLDAKDTKVTKSSATPAKSETKSETTSEAKPTAKQMSGSGMGAMERMDGMYKKGGSIKRKMKSKKK